MYSWPMFINDCLFYLIDVNNVFKSKFIWLKLLTERHEISEPKDSTSCVIYEE